MIPVPVYTKLAGQDKYIHSYLNNPENLYIGQVVMSDEGDLVVKEFYINEIDDTYYITFDKKSNKD